MQLAAHRSRQGAATAWDMLRADQAELLGAFDPAFIKTPLADGGVVYRLVVGSFTTKAEADGLCARLKQRSVDCFVPRN